jgi:hypothetical protein
MGGSGDGSFFSSAVCKATAPGVAFPNEKLHLDELGSAD